MARNRIIYASQSVWCNGEVLYRVQSLGSTTTFTSEDIFELGHLDIVDVVDDVPAVAVTLNTNDFGDVKTLAILAQVAPAKKEMVATATTDNANLVVVSGTQLDPTSTFLHGVGLADFAIVCGNLPGVTISAPVQDECSLGTLADNIDQTLFLDEVYVNSLEFGYTTGANATENYGAETDNKMWLLNDARFVNFDNWTLAGTGETYVNLTIASGIVIPALSTGKMAFLRKDDNGAPAATFYDTSEIEVMNYEVEAGTAAKADKFVYDAAGVGEPGGHQLYFPTDILPVAAGDVLEVSYAANDYGSDTADKYFTALSSIERPDFMGAIRQGQVEIYIVDPALSTEWDIAWRLTGCTITADLTREALAELGHLSPYDRPLTLPIPITVTIDTTAGDLENWAKIAGQTFDGNLDDIDLSDLTKKEDLLLVATIYAQTDEEAGGTGALRVVAGDSTLIDQAYWNNGTRAIYVADDQEYALKTIVVEHLKITDEGATLDMGANMTQTFGFRSTNDLFAVKGDFDVAYITGDFKIRRQG
jgi:hypothetical protein